MPFEQSTTGASFLKKRFDLHSTEDASRAKEKTERLTGDKVSQKPEAVIQNYLDRFSHIFNPENAKQKSRNIEMMKRVFFKNYVIKSDNIPESYFELQRRIATERGQGADFPDTISEEMRGEAYEIIKHDQEESLEYWIDYLSGDNATYPDWAKYWAMRSVLTMGEYDKERQAFRKRGRDTTAPFPDLNQEALTTTFEYIQNQAEGKQTENPIQEPENLFADEVKAVSDEDFQKLLTTENFARYYAFAIEHVVADNSELYKITEGEWRKLHQGSDATELTETLQGKGTGWCTAGTRTAETQLENGDFYVYYSKNNLGEAKIPRLAIRMEGENIAEVRGVAHKQEVDPYITDVLTEKMSEFGTQGEQYQKKANDMKILTEIDEKNKAGKYLSSEDLRFIYEMDGPIEGFGYSQDPRIEELCADRNQVEDAKTLFNCNRGQIATNTNEINCGTKVYMGSWSAEVYQKLPLTIEYICRSQLSEKIFFRSIELSTKTGQEYEWELRGENIGIESEVEYLLSKLVPRTEAEAVKLIEFSVAELGFTSSTQYDEICARAKEIGLELCSPETGPEVRLQYRDQKVNDWVRIAMESLSDRGGTLRLWSVIRDDGDLWLSTDYGRPGFEWYPSFRFLFVACK
jgi:hypothetical protein